MSSDYLKYALVNSAFEFPPVVLDGLDRRYVNHDELKQPPPQAFLVTDYGAVPDTTASQSAAFQAALNAASAAGMPLVVPGGRYRLTGMIDLPDNTDLRMSPTTVLDFSGSGASYYLQVRGAAGTPVAYAAQIKKGDRAIPLAGHGMVAGDWFMLRSADNFDPGSTGSFNGELLQVHAVTSGSVELVSPVCDDYRTQPTITPVAMRKNVRVSGGKLVGTKSPAAGRTGIRIQYADDLQITGFTCEDVDTVHAPVRDSVNVWFRWCSFKWTAANYMGYGTSFSDTTRDSGTIHCYFQNIRHGFSTNNTTVANDSGVPRRITCDDNRVEYTAGALTGDFENVGGAALDTHTAAEDIWITGNTVNGSRGQGINVECPTARIQDNTVINSASWGITWMNKSQRPGSAIITGNKVAGAVGRGLYARSGSAGQNAPIEALVLTGNHVQDTTEEGIQVGYVNTDYGLIVTGNMVLRAGTVPIKLTKLDGLILHSNIVAGGAAVGIECDAVTHAVIGPDSIRAGAPTGRWVGLKLTNVTRSKITPGSVHVDDPAGVGVEVGSSCSDLSLGPTSHLDAPTQLVNNGPATVRSY